MSELRRLPAKCGKCGKSLPIFASAVARFVLGRLAPRALVITWQCTNCGAICPIDASMFKAAQGRAGSSEPCQNGGPGID